MLAAPAEHAATSAQELSARLSARLEELRERESQRPYYHYQNLYHDPRGATIGSSVIPSPLAGGPDDALVRIDPAAYFRMPWQPGTIGVLGDLEFLAGTVVTVSPRICSGAA